MPLAEQQAHWVADLITGEVDLPSVRRDARADRGVRRRRCGGATSPRKRHTIQVDAHKYRAELPQGARSALTRSDRLRGSTRRSVHTWYTYRVSIGHRAVD